MSTYYYVYAYLREDGSPYYIGKGKGQRAFQKHRIPVPNNENRIVFLERNLSEIGALALERRYIRWYGRKDQSSGILRNLTDGGDGTAGLVCSNETRQKLHRANIGKRIAEETLQKRLGRKQSIETKQKRSEALKGRHHSLETRQKMCKPKSEQAKQNMRKPKSTEHVEKARIARLASIARQKGLIHNE